MKYIKSYQQPERSNVTYHLFMDGANWVVYFQRFGEEMDSAHPLFHFEEIPSWMREELRCDIKIRQEEVSAHWSVRKKS